MNILLITPPGTFQECLEGMSEAGGLAAVIEMCGHHPLIVDGQIRSLAEIHSLILEKKSGLVCLILPQAYSLSPWLNQLLVGIKTKNPEYHITAVGKAATLIPRRLLKMFPELDSVIPGEAEIAMTELIKVGLLGKGVQHVRGLIYRADSEIIANPEQPLIENLDELPLAKRSYLKDKNRYPVAPMWTIRTNYASPNFSLNTIFQRRNGVENFRAMSVHRLIEELLKIKTHYDCNNFYFVDDNFFADGNIGKRRAEQICLEIIARSLKIQLAMKCLWIDVEKKLFALLKQAGLRKVLVGFIFQPPSLLENYPVNKTTEQMKHTITVLEELEITWQPDYILFDPLLSFNEFIFCLQFLEQTILPRYENATNISIFNQMELFPDSDHKIHFTNDHYVDPRLRVIFTVISYYKKRKIEANQYIAKKISESPHDKLTAKNFSNWRKNLYKLDFQVLKLITEHLKRDINELDDGNFRQQLQQTLITYHRNYFDENLAHVPEKNPPIQFQYPEQFMLFYLMKNWSHITYRGHALWQNLFDLHIVREFLFSHPPDLIIETGTYKGGSALFFADMMRLTNKRPQIISIDPAPKATPPCDGVIYLLKSSCDPKVLQWLRKYIHDNDIENIFVQLDALHDEDFVYRELSLYSSLLRPNNYILVQDGAAHGTNSGGPLGAIKRFLDEHKNFIHDDSICRGEFARVTWSPLGWLKKLSEEFCSSQSHPQKEIRRERENDRFYLTG